MQDQQIQELLTKLNEQENTYHQYVVSELQKAEVDYKEAASKFKEAEKELISAQGAASTWVNFLADKYSVDISPPETAA